MKESYPKCKTIDTVEDWFGTVLPDPYSWLKNAQDPEVLDFVARENEYTDHFFDSVKLKNKIEQLKAQKLPELPTRIWPWKDGYLAGRQREGDYEICILDKNLEMTGAFPKIAALDGVTLFEAKPCPVNESIVALMVQHPGAARPAVAVCDLDKCEVLREIREVFSYCWSRADGCLYYSTTKADAAVQSSCSIFYRFDPRKEQETVVYEDDGYSVFGQVFASSDGKSIMAMICRDYSVARWAEIQTTTGEVCLLTENPVEWSYLDTVQEAHYFVAKTDAPHGAVIRLKKMDGCGNKSVDMDEDKAECCGAVRNGVARYKSEIVLPETERILNSGFSCKEQLYVLASKDVSSCLVCVDTGEEIPLPEQHCALSLAGNAGDGVFLKFESFVTAPSLLLYDGEVLKKVMGSTEEEHADVCVEQLFAPSTEDGTAIPYYLVRRRDAVPDGERPVLMYAYGGYNISMPPCYTEMVTNIPVARWVEAGGVYVHCNLRGGDEYGSEWHEAGMLKNKRHCYEDFIGIAEQVIRDGWTKKGKIGISGCSNGGLLMSALVTMRPDLWGCVIDSVPHTDMIHFAEDDRGPMYITEYGNPRESREMFEYLLSYSPYHNIRETDYPPIYIQTGEMDNNVPPYHGKKFAARMQANNQSDNPVLLRVLAKGSHDRGQGEAFWKTIAEMQLFLERFLKGD
ncbi:MAG: prolyl oligopeptidase family serine peptidase [Clostridiales bacterium]|nr:prolyl oligopeptidase family serine peptidase [Clostridiales bacterium]